MSRSRPSIALCMIVRDESAVIERCLASVAGLVDTWVISDTGSRDETPLLIDKALSHLPGKLHHSPWHDFGRNRTELMTMARGEADYLLLLDADMTVEQTGPLPELKADAYLLRETGSLDFGVLRLVRGDRHWWYEGSTHEYLCTDGRFAQEELPVLAITHHGDGASRQGKLMRDLGLLKREVARPDHSPRSAFYLAQTYRDLGHRPAAIEWYRKRVEAGGWDEEVFYANLQEGVLRLEDGLAEGAPVLLEAWQRRPSRAEPLYELARAYRTRRQYDLAEMFSARGMSISYPSDVLFVHRSVYQWGLSVEHAVALAALGRTDEARHELQGLLDTGALDNEIETYVITRLAEIELLTATQPVGTLGAGEVPRLASLAPSLRIGEVKLDVRPQWPSFNPSVAADGDGFRMIVRTANYRIEQGVAHEDGLLRNNNYLLALDGGLAVESVTPLDDEVEGLRLYPSRVLGYEDCRLIQVGETWYASATACELNPIERREIALLTLEGPSVKAVRALRGPNPGRHEKNWMPFVHRGTLHFVYSCGPTVVLGVDVDSGQTTVVHEGVGPEGAETFRGGSQGVALDDGTYLFMVHEVERSVNKARYVHRFVHMTDELLIDSVSIPFTFTSDRVEFCGGMARRSDDLVLSFGVSDAACGLGLLKLDEALATLRDVRQRVASNSL